MFNPGLFDIEVQRNAVKPLGFTLYDDYAKAPLDMTGMSLKCQVRAAGGQSNPVIAEFSATINNAKNGQFDISFDGRALNTVPGTSQNVELVYDVLDNASEGPVVLMRGAIVLTPGVTF